jgi:hypothetical protein
MHVKTSQGMLRALLHGRLACAPPTAHRALANAADAYSHTCNLPRWVAPRVRRELQRRSLAGGCTEWNRLTTREGEGYVTARTSP